MTAYRPCRHSCRCASVQAFAALALSLALATVSVEAQVNVSNTPFNSHQQQIAAAGKNVYVVWMDDSFGNGDILFARSTDRAETFEDWVNLSLATGTSEGNALAPQIAVSGKNVFVVWDEGRLFAKSDIYAAVSRDEGVTFETFDLSQGRWEHSDDPQVSATGNAGHFTWIEGGLGGTTNRTFGQYVKLTVTPGGVVRGLRQITAAASTLRPKVESLGERVYLAYEDQASFVSEVYLAVSFDGGEGFPAGALNLSSSAAMSEYPQLILSGDQVYVSWNDRDAAGFRCLLRSSSDGGVTFSSPTSITAALGLTGCPRMVAEGDDVYAVWQAGTLDVFFASSSDRGISFSSPSDLGDNSRDLMDPRIVVLGSDAYTLWHDNTDAVSADLNTEIAYRRIINRGTDFAPPFNLSSDATPSLDPVMAPQRPFNSNLFPTYVYVAWEDRGANGNGDIMVVKRVERRIRLRFFALGSLLVAATIAFWGFRRRRGNP